MGGVGLFARGGTQTGDDIAEPIRDGRNIRVNEFQAWKRDEWERRFGGYDEV